MIILFKSGFLISYNIFEIKKNKKLKLIERRIDQFSIIPKSNSILVLYRKKRGQNKWWVNKFMKWDYKINRVYYRRKIDEKSPAFNQFSSVSNIKVLPNGKNFVTLLFDKTIVLWDVNTGRLKKIISNGELGEVQLLSISPDGKSVLSKFEKNNVFKEFNIESRICIATNKHSYFDFNNVLIIKSKKKPFF